MTNVCKILHAMKKDEANGILEYAKLKNLMPSEHEEHINTIEGIISDEHKHLMEILEIIKEMNCPELTPIEEIYMIGKYVYEKANEIEKLSGNIGNSGDSKRLKEIAEDLEEKVKEIKAIAKK